MPTRQSNLNTLVGVASLLVLVIGFVLYLAPLKTLPGEVEDVRGKLGELATTQRVQTEALKTLAEVASDSKQMRRDVDRNSADNRRIDSELEDVKRRLDKLEVR